MALQDQLATACGKGDLAAVKAAIASGASVHSEGKNDVFGIDEMPLAAAAGCHHQPVVLHLLSVGADPNGRDVMSAGVLSGTPEILQLLIDAGGHLNTSNGLVLAPPVFSCNIAGGDAEGKLRVLLAEPGLGLAASFGGHDPVENALYHEKPALAAMIRDEVGHCGLNWSVSWSTVGVADRL